jgi:CheY-like chemotaxis protein
MRVLVVDDEALVREAICRALEKAGHAVATASNGLEALRHFDGPPGERPDVVVLDVRMPVMDGRAFMQARRFGRALADVPVVIVTGYSDVCFEGVEVLEKPFGTDDVVAAVERAARPPRHLAAR